MPFGFRQSIRFVDENYVDPKFSGVEIVERKGIGHPDTLAELVADEFIRCYAEYSLAHLGVVPNVSVDKTMLIGALASLGLGSCAIERDARALLVGKITRFVGSAGIPVEDLFRASVKNVLEHAGLAGLLGHMSFEVINNDRFTDDHDHEMYRPPSVVDVRGADPSRWVSADTAAVSFEGPSTAVERFVIELEQELTGDGFRLPNPQFGTDVKVLATRHGRSVDVTLCIPVKAEMVPSRSHYRDALEIARLAARDVGHRYADHFTAVIRVNTKDTAGGAYLTAFGSSLDKGDQGSTGRGNGPLGVNSTERRKSAEAVAGKNPFNHPAKIYTHLARVLVADVAATYRVPIRVAVTSRNGEPLIHPSNVFVQLGGRARGGPCRDDVYEVIAERGASMLADLDGLSTRLALADPVAEFRAAGGRLLALASGR